MNRTLQLRTFLAASIALISTSFAAADIIHSDVTGNSVWFTQITEGSPTADPLPLYSQPFANGDQLVFAPTAAFSAVSNSGGPSNMTDGKLSLIIESKPGAYISKLDFEEGGLTSLNAPFGGDSFASVLAFAELKLLEVNDVPVVSPASTHFYNFAPDSSWLHSADATGPGFATGWIGTLSLNLPEKVTKVQLVIDNQLYASTVGVGTGALIDKKVFSISVTPDGSVNPNVPEPSTLALLALCAMSFAGRRR
jgi:hypothetical protein